MERTGIGGAQNARRKSQEIAAHLQKDIHAAVLIGTDLQNISLYSDIGARVLGWIAVERRIARADAARLELLGSGRGAGDFKRADAVFIVDLQHIADLGLHCHGLSQRPSVYMLGSPVGIFGGDHEILTAGRDNRPLLRASHIGGAQARDRFRGALDGEGTGEALVFNVDRAECILLKDSGIDDPPSAR